MTVAPGRAERQAENNDLHANSRGARLAPVTRPSPDRASPE
jgi:hypothetical protein